MNKKDTKEAWNWLSKFGTEDQKKLFRPVYAYIKDLEKRLKLLEDSLEKKMSPQLSQSATQDPSVDRFLKLKEELSKPFEATPLKERLSILDDRGMRFTKEWALNLKWNRLTEAMADELIKSFRENNKK